MRNLAVSDRSVSNLSTTTRRAAGRLVRGVARRAGFELVRPHDVATIPRRRTEPFQTAEYDVVPRGAFDIVRRTYYSPIPDLTRLPEHVWTRRSALAGVDLAAERAIAFVERELSPWIAEMDVPVADSGVRGRFFMGNPGFATVDAELLYAMIRAMRPERVVELGSGYSTLLINQACRRNCADGAATVHEAFDPFPRPHILGDKLPEPSRLTAISATDVPLDVFSSLSGGDILFVDTTHTVKLASDVNFIVLDVLPVLAAGVVVHFHDIFLPWEYPRHWLTEMHWYWTEQYLLQAFLTHNRDFEVVIPAHVLARDHPERLAAVIPSFAPPAAPGSMWLRRR